MPALAASSGTQVGGLARRQLDRLAMAASIAPEARQRLHEVFCILTEGALDRPARPPFSGLSGINANGLPLQWSISVGSGAADVRFLCEGGPIGSPGPLRTGATLQRLKKACAIAGVRGADFVEEIAREHLLPKAGQWPSHWRSAVWTAVGAAGDRIGFKTYFNLTAGEPVDRWKRAGRLLQALDRPASLERLCQYSGAVSRNSWPAGIAIGVGSETKAGGVKIYFRSGDVDAAWLARWYHGSGFSFDEEAIRLLLETFAPPSRDKYPPGSFVVSLEFPTDDSPPAIKTEIEVSRWSEEEQDASSRVRRLLSGLRLDPSAYESALQALAPDPRAATIHRLAGVRSDPSGRHRVNVYLEPPLIEPEEPIALQPIHRASKLSAVGAARNAIHVAASWLDNTRIEASWTDFDLPVGRSDRWVTAYVSVAISQAASSSPQLRRLVRESCTWLGDNCASQGWGYNAMTPGDADSTALAILALRANGYAPPAAAFHLLQSCRHPGGGIATYPPATDPGGAWCAPTVDVTPVAVEALGEAQEHSLPWILPQQRGDGLWNAYWWATPLYPSWWVARVYGRSLPEDVRARLARGVKSWNCSGAFEHALAAMALRSLEEDPSLHKAALLDLQRTDGSWPGSAWLRLSHPAISDPWSHIDSGPCFRDENAIFTTATALAALAI